MVVRWRERDNSRHSLWMAPSISVVLVLKISKDCHLLTPLPFPLQVLTQYMNDAFLIKVCAYKWRAYAVDLSKLTSHSSQKYCPDLWLESSGPKKNIWIQISGTGETWWLWNSSSDKILTVGFNKHKRKCPPPLFSFYILFFNFSW